MKKKYKIILLIFLITILITVFLNNRLYGNIEEVFQSQEQAIRNKDMEAYLETISPRDKEYLAEKESWLRDILINDIKGYGLKVIDLDRISFNKVQATVLQSYSYLGDDHELVLPLLVTRSKGSWKDSDLNFKELKTQNFVIKYFNSSKKSAQFIKLVCEESKDNIENRYGEVIEERTTVKIYPDLEMLRQSVKLSFPWKFAGWYEYPESVKTGEYDHAESYKRVLEHELVHKLTIMQSNNNMPYWFTEGLAVYFSNFHNDPDQIKTKEQYMREYNNNRLDILTLEAINLEKIENHELISNYYDSAGLIVQFMIESYGIERVKNIVNSLGSYPYQKGTGAEVDLVAKDRFQNVIKNDLGMDLIELNEAYKLYINN